MSFPAYAEYKDSTVPWVGEIPAHWECTRLKNIFELMKRTPSDDDQIVTAFRDGEVTLRVNRRVEGYTNAIQEHGYQQVHPNDLVIHAMDAFAGAIGVSDSRGKSTPVYSVCRQRRHEDNVYYFARLLRYMALSGFINSLAKGIRERSTEFRWKESANIVIPWPPVGEQNAIAAFLGTETSKIDGLVSEQRRLIELLKEKRQAVISHAVTKGLNPDVKMKPSGIQWLGDVPEHWRASKLRWYCDSIRDGTHNPPPRADGIHRLLSVRNIIDGKFVLRDDDRTMKPDAFAELQRSYTVEPGDVLLAIVGGTTGKSAVATQLENVTVQRSLAIIRPTQNRLNSHFLNYWIRSDSLQGKIQETVVKYAAQPGIYLDEVAGLAVPIPPMEEQAEIVASLNGQTVELDTLIAQAERAIELLQERRTALISAAVTGKIDVRGYKPEEAVA